MTSSQINPKLNVNALNERIGDICKCNKSGNNHIFWMILICNAFEIEAITLLLRLSCIVGLNCGLSYTFFQVLFLQFFYCLDMNENII